MTGFERKALTAWAACWAISAALIALARHLNTTPKGD